MTSRLHDNKRPNSGRIRGPAGDQSGPIRLHSLRIDDVDSRLPVGSTGGQFESHRSIHSLRFNDIPGVFESISKAIISHRNRSQRQRRSSHRFSTIDSDDCWKDTPIRMSFQEYSRKSTDCGTSKVRAYTNILAQVEITNSVTRTLRLKSSAEMMVQLALQ